MYRHPPCMRCRSMVSVWMGVNLVPSTSICVSPSCWGFIDNPNSWNLWYPLNPSFASVTSENRGLCCCRPSSVDWDEKPRDTDSMSSTLSACHAGHRSQARTRPQGFVPRPTLRRRAERWRHRPRGKGAKPCRVTKFTGIGLAMHIYYR